MKNHLNVILSGTPSDSHIWNLIFMELFLKENNCQVRNLGACVSIPTLYESINEFSPELVVISSINGYLFQDAINIINTLSSKLPSHLPPLAAGGLIGISKTDTSFRKHKLLKLGYKGIFVEDDALPQFKTFLKQIQINKHKRDWAYAL